MKITFLGTGSAYGTPYCGNGWQNGVDKNNIKNNRLRYSLLLEDNNNQLLIDCSPDFRQQSIKHNLNSFNDVFYTHWHADHIFGTWELDEYTTFYKKHLNLWADKKTLKVLNDKFDYLLCDKERFTLNEIKPFKNHKIANMDIIPLKCIHGDLYSYGLKYKNIAITSDLEYIPPINNKYLENLDLWVMECNNIEYKDNGGHTYLEQALERIKQFKPQKTILTHFSSHWDYETMSKKVPENVILAWDGMEIDL